MHENNVSDSKDNRAWKRTNIVEERTRDQKTNKTQRNTHTHTGPKAIGKDKLEEQ